jgi:hypothetical protein
MHTSYCPRPAVALKIILAAILSAVEPRWSLFYSRRTAGFSATHLALEVVEDSGSRRSLRTGIVSPSPYLVFRRVLREYGARVILPEKQQEPSMVKLEWRTTVIVCRIRLSTAVVSGSRDTGAPKLCFEVQRRPVDAFYPCSSLTTALETWIP